MILVAVQREEKHSSPGELIPNAAYARRLGLLKNASPLRRTTATDVGNRDWTSWAYHSPLLENLSQEEGRIKIEMSQFP